MVSWEPPELPPVQGLAALAAAGEGGHVVEMGGIPGPGGGERLGAGPGLQGVQPGGPSPPAALGAGSLLRIRGAAPRRQGGGEGDPVQNGPGRDGPVLPITAKTDSHTIFRHRR